MTITNSIYSLSISHWNIKGLHDPIFGCKLQLPELTKIISEYDINILSKTWGCSHEINIPNYEVGVIPPNKIKDKKSGRSSGGITVIYRSNLKSKLEFTKSRTNYMWIKFLNLKSFNSLAGNADSLYTCAVYVPPESSPYFSDEIFHDLSTEISCLAKSKIPVIQCGDFNARTGNVTLYTTHR